MTRLKELKKHPFLRSETGRIAGTGMKEGVYSDDFNPTDHVGRRIKTKETCSGTIMYEMKKPGVNGVMLPDGLDGKEYKKYVESKAGPVKTYNIKDIDKEEKK